MSNPLAPAAATPSRSATTPGSESPSAPRAVLSICVSCRSPDGGVAPGASLLAALEAAIGEDTDIVVRPVQCLSVCKRPCTAALSGPERYSYVFGDLDPESGAEALLACARSYLVAEHGYLLWKERPEPLRRGTIVRIPPPGWIADDGRHPR